MTVYNLKGWLIATLLLFLYTPSFCQMVLKFDLSGTEINSGIVQIGVYNLDTTRVIYSKEFSGQMVQCNLELQDSVLLNNSVLRWTMTRDSFQNFTSFFMASNDTVIFTPSNHRVIYDKDHPFYDFIQLSNNYDNSQLSKDLLVNELKNLYSSGSYTNYIEFIIYNALKNGLIKPSELLIIDFNFNHKSTWGSEILELIDNDSNKDVVDQFREDNSLCLIKFWATWCKPCLIDNEILKDLFHKGNLKITVLGIQADDTNTGEDFFYKNLTDQNGYFTRKYEVKSFPSYLLYEDSELVVRTDTLTEILSYLNNRN